MGNVPNELGFRHIEGCPKVEVRKVYNNTSRLGFGDVVYAASDGYAQKAVVGSADTNLGSIISIWDGDGVTQQYIPATSGTVAKPWTITIAPWRPGDRVEGVFSDGAPALTDLGGVYGMAFTDCDTATGNSNMTVDFATATGNCLRLVQPYGRAEDSYGASMTGIFTPVKGAYFNSTNI